MGRRFPRLRLRRRAGHDDARLGRVGEHGPGSLAGLLAARGDVLDVKVLEVDEEKRRISLGLKQALGDPWVDVAQKFPVGSAIDGPSVLYRGIWPTYLAAPLGAALSRRWQAIRT